MSTSMSMKRDPLGSSGNNVSVPDIEMAGYCPSQFIQACDLCKVQYTMASVESALSYFQTDEGVDDALEYLFRRLCDNGEAELASVYYHLATKHKREVPEVVQNFLTV